MLLGREVGLGPCHIVLDGDPAPLLQRVTATNIWPMSIVDKRSRISATAEHMFVFISFLQLAAMLALQALY